MGGRPTMPRTEREEMFHVEQAPKRSGWSIPASIVAAVGGHAVAVVLWLNSQLAPIPVLVEKISELSRRVELLEEEHRRIREARP